MPRARRSIPKRRSRQSSKRRSRRSSNKRSTRSRSFRGSQTSTFAPLSKRPPPPPFIMQPNPDNTPTPSVQWSKIFDKILNEVFGGFDYKISNHEIEMNRRRHSVWDKLRKLYPDSKIPTPEEYVGIHEDATQEELNFVIDMFVKRSVNKHIDDQIEEALKVKAPQRVHKREQERRALHPDSFPELS